MNQKRAETLQSVTDSLIKGTNPRRFHYISNRGTGTLAHALYSENLAEELTPRLLRYLIWDNLDFVSKDELDDIIETIFAWAAGNNRPSVRIDVPDRFHRTAFEFLVSLPDKGNGVEMLSTPDGKQWLLYHRCLDSALQAAYSERWTAPDSELTQLVRGNCAKCGDPTVYRLGIDLTPLCGSQRCEAND